MQRFDKPFSNRRMFMQETLRIKLIDSYPKTTGDQSFEPTELSIQNFISGMVKWLQYANTPYSQRDQHGLYYAEDYIKNYGYHDDVRNINGLANPTYWDIRTHSCLFKAKEGHTPNQLLNAFFDGPTMTECASVLQACIYRSIEEMTGTKEFNRVFNSSQTPFLITPILFDKIYSSEEKPNYSLDVRMKAGNPLLFLFDTIEHPTEQNINLGDILYIKGVDKYAEKHLAGSGSGWNVICVGKNTNQENLYAGFGPDSFSKPLTYQEIKSLLIKYYNADPLKETKSIINENDKETSFLMTAKTSLAKALANDKVAEDYPIVGLQYGLRINKQKLENFLTHSLKPWHALTLEELEEKTSHAPAPSNVKHITTFTMESRGKTFDDYKATTQAQIDMLSIAKKFALTVCNSRNAHVGLVMTGMPGIGKTHLSVAVADYVAKHSLKVAFVDESTIGNTFQKMCEKSGGMVSMDSVFADWLKDIDLIVLDDMNEKYGISGDFLKLAIEYATKNKKAIMITSNHVLDTIKENVADYIGYDNENRNNFFVIQGLQGHSYRKQWWNQSTQSSYSGQLKTNQDVIEILVNLKKNEPAGIILEEKDINLEKISEKYLKLSPEKNIKIRILQEPYRNQRVYDLYIHDFAEHDIFIMKFEGGFGETEQLLHLISHVHDLGKKLIIVTNDETQLHEHVKEKLSSYLGRDTKERLQDRMHNLLLKKTEWANVQVQMSYQPMNDPNNGTLPIAQHQNIKNITVGPRAPSIDHKLPDLSTKMTLDDIHSSILDSLSVEDLTRAMHQTKPNHDTRLLTYKHTPINNASLRFTNQFNKNLMQLDDTTKKQLSKFLRGQRPPL